MLEALLRHALTLWKHVVQTSPLSLSAAKLTWALERPEKSPSVHTHVPSSFYGKCQSPDKPKLEADPLI